MLTDFPAVISPDEARQLPRENVFMLSTGSQGERRAASAQLATGNYRGLRLTDGDMFLFSSKTIPGNEVPVANVMNNFSVLGVDVVEDHSGKYHVSGHANRPDLSDIHSLLKPKILVPMHGEHRHLKAHCDLGRENGLVSQLAPNGTMLDLTGDVPEVIDQIETGRIYLDGSMIIGALDGIIRARLRMSFNGHVSVGVIVDEDDEVLTDALVEIHGLAERSSDGDLVEMIEEAVSGVLMRADDKTVMDDDELTSAVIKGVRSVVVDVTGKKPEINVLISRLLSG